MNYSRFFRRGSWAGCSSMVICDKSGSVVLNSFEAVYLGACMWVPNIGEAYSSFGRTSIL